MLFKVCMKLLSSCGNSEQNKQVCVDYNVNFFLSYSKQIQLLCTQKLVEMYAVYVKSVLLLR